LDEDFFDKCGESEDAAEEMSEKLD